MKKKYLNKSIALLMVLMLLGCSTSNRFSMQNLNYLYSENLDGHLITKAFKKSDSVVTIYLNMLQQGSQGTSFTSGQIPLSYAIYGTEKNDGFYKEDSLFPENNGFPDEDLKFEIVLPPSGNHHLRITIEDAGEEKYTVLEYIKNNRFSEENFILMDSAGNALLFPYLGQSNTFKVLSNTLQAEKAWVYYYKREFHPAAPPFNYVKTRAYSFKPDSVFQLTSGNGRNTMLHIAKRGFYHLLADTSQREGYTVFKYEDAFPEISSARDMLLPLRYITSSEEYRQLSEADNLRIAVEEFWLKMKGNIERARHSIKRYYSRVEDANILFSSYLQGWKSDRGMIYIIYGPPTLVSRDNKSEVWFYGERNSPGVLRFEFIKVNNPFTDNDFQLLRSPNYKESWYINVDNWRR